MAAALKLLAGTSVTTGAVSIPSLRSVSEEVTRLESLRTNIGSKRSALMSERVRLADELQTQHVNVSSGSGSDQGLTKEARSIAAILGDPPPLPRTAPPVNTGMARLREISEELGALEKAEQELARRLTTAQRAASVVVCEQVREVHAALAEQLLQALKAAHLANLAYTEFADRVNSENISWSDLNPILPRFLGDPKNKYAPLAQFLMDAAEVGWIKPTDIPREIRP